MGNLHCPGARSSGGAPDTYLPCVSVSGGTGTRAEQRIRGMPHLKLQLRGLPVGSTASDVDALLAAAFPAEATRPSLVYFEGGKVRRDKTVVAARCCVECPADAGDDEAAEGFLRVLGSCALTNAAGKCSLVQAVVSPYQKLPHADTIVDPRDNTISSDPVCEFRDRPV